MTHQQYEKVPITFDNIKAVYFCFKPNTLELRKSMRSEIKAYLYRFRWSVKNVHLMHTEVIQILKENGVDMQDYELIYECHNG